MPEGGYSAAVKQPENDCQAGAAAPGDLADSAAVRRRLAADDRERLADERERDLDVRDVQITSREKHADAWERRRGQATAGVRANTQSTINRSREAVERTQARLDRHTALQQRHTSSGIDQQAEIDGEVSKTQLSWHQQPTGGMEPTVQIPAAPGARPSPTFAPAPTSSLARAGGRTTASQAR